MRRVRRSRIALCLIVIYSMIIVSPLAPVTLRSMVLARAVTAECAGECDICGCAPEQRSNHTCCCAKKKELEREKSADHDKNLTHILSCGCPCDDDNLQALWDTDNSELLPYRFTEEILAFHESDLSPLYPGRRADRSGDPPDPPPKLAVLS